MRKKYSFLSLIKNAFTNNENWEKMWESPDPKKGYDVIKCSFNDINISFNRFSKGFSIKNKNVDLHGVWVRFIGNGTLQEITYKL